MYYVRNPRGFVKKPYRVHHHIYCLWTSGNTKVSYDINPAYGLDLKEMFQD